MIRFFQCALILAGLMMSGCATDAPKTPAVPPAPGVLRVGVSPNNAPYSYSVEGRMEGIEPALARALAPALKRKLRFVELNQDQLVSALENGEIDIIMSGIHISDVLGERVEFCDPYLQIGQMILMRSPDTIRYQYPQVVLMSEARIGVEKDTSGDFLVQGGAVEAKRKVYKSVDRAVQDLINNKIDALVHDGPVVLMLASHYASDRLAALNGSVTEQYLAWAVRKEDMKLLNAILRVQDAWKKDGTSDKIIRDALPFVRR